MNTNTHLNSNRLRRATRWRFNPVRNLTVDSLTNQLDAFEAGYLREAVGTWDTIEKRDDILRCVIPKRVKAIARHGWVVLPARDLAEHEKAEAQKHIAALEYFYRNLHAENAVDMNERGGFALLVRQMMDAIGKRYAVHEIIWRPKADGTLSACFRLVPLSFFENTTGQLRFLETENAMAGAPLRESEWMVTVGDGLMMASSIAWMFKHLSLNDWSLYSEHNGTPGLRATTSATRDSDEWKAIETTVQDLYEGMPVVTNTGDEIKVVDFAVGGNIPFPGLVERMDRVLAAMWRGADLSTLSRDRGYGASLQEKESCVLEQDDGELLGETLHRYVDRWVIRYLFGENAEPLARIKILVSGLPATADDARIDEFLLKHGAPLSVASVLERYGRAVANSGEPLLNIPGTEPAGSGVMSHLENSRGPGSSGHELDAAAANLRLSNAADSAFIFEVGQASRLSRPAPSAVEGRSFAPSPGEAPGGTGEAPVLPSVRARLANSEAFSVLQKEWVQLSPYGDFPHAQGLQRVTFESARAMERNFATLAARASRLFAGAPMFVGHPDVPQFANQFPDRKAYGWIMALEARPDGLYGKMKWSAPGLELLQNGHYKFLSPYWEARQVAEENGRAVFEPVALISAGLTNEPNLPVLPLANTKPAPELANVRAAIDDALANGRLAPARIIEMQHELAEDWEAASAKLRAAPIVMHTRAYTEKLGARKNEVRRFSNRRNRIQEHVTSKMAQGLGYDQAWNAVKEEHPALFS